MRGKYRRKNSEQRMQKITCQIHLNTCTVFSSLVPWNIPLICFRNLHSSQSFFIIYFRRLIIWNLEQLRIWIRTIRIEYKNNRLRQDVQLNGCRGCNDPWELGHCGLIKISVSTSCPFTSRSKDTHLQVLATLINKGTVLFHSTRSKWVESSSLSTNWIQRTSCMVRRDELIVSSMTVAIGGCALRRYWH